MRDEKTKEEDILFLISMKGDRKAQVGKPDGDYEKKCSCQKEKNRRSSKNEGGFDPTRHFKR